MGSSRLRVRRRAALAVSFSAAALALPAAAGAAPAGKVITVKASTVINMAGSDVYCTVNAASTGPGVACFHDPGGPSSNVRKGYAVAALDAGVVVEPPGSTKPVKQLANPSLSAFPKIPGGTAHPTLVTLARGDIALVGGSHMAIGVQPATAGGNAIGVFFLDGAGNLVAGTYTIGISNHYVTIVEIIGKDKTKTVWRHAVY
jgi:hypothetical protein